MMRALKINFGGPNAVSLDWNKEVSGISAVAQRAGVAVMTQEGSDKFIPTRGTGVTKVILSYGVFDILGMQHTLNFGALKARQDMQAFEQPTRAASARVDSIRMSLLDVKDNAARVSVVVTNQAGETTREIKHIS